MFWKKQNSENVNCIHHHRQIKSDIKYTVYSVNHLVMFVNKNENWIFVLCFNIWNSRI